MNPVRRPIPLLALVLYAACLEPSTPLPGADAEFTLITTDVWAGDTILVRSAWFATLRAAAETTVSVTLGGDTLAVWYAGGDTLAVQAPFFANQGAPLVLRFPGGRADVGTVAVRGYVGEQFGPPVGGVYLPWPAGSPVPSLLAYGRDGIVRVDLRYGTAALLVPYDSASPMSCNWGPAPTHRPNAVVMCRRIWHLAPAPTPGDSVPYPSHRLTAVLAGGARVDLDHHEVIIHDADGGVTSLGTEEADEIRVSPRGDRIAIKTWTGFYPRISGQEPPAGYPVWDSLGHLAFAVGRLDSVGVVPGFSLTGDTVFAATVSPDTLFVIDADDGTVLDAVGLPSDLEPMAVAPDPDAARVYVYGWRNGDGGLAVVSLLAARLEVYLPSPWFRGENPEIVFDRVRRELYVAFGDNLGSSPLEPADLRPMHSIRFTLPP